MEEGRHGWLGRIDITVRKLLAVLGVIGRWPPEDHEAAIQHQKPIVLPLGVVCGRLRLLPMLPLLEPPDKNRFMRT